MPGNTERVFSDRELADAGRLTVDLITERLQQGQRIEAKELVRRFHNELMAMFFSYTGIEQSILECIAQLDGEAGRAAALVEIEDWNIAPERKIETHGVVKSWNAELDHIKELIDGDSGSQACERACTLRKEALILHDGLMSRVTALLSIVYENHREEALKRILDQVMKPESMDPDGALPFKEKVESIMYFTRSHLLPFTITEDDEKVTFMPDPCPSGARLIQGGHYESPRNNAIVRGSSSLTYGRREFPVYCCHEPSMELSSVLRTGVPLFIVDPPEDVGISPCKIYVYKNSTQIPEAYYRRLGLEKPDDLIARSCK